MHTTRFCLIRHGETDWNRERRLQGHLDIPLNPRGLQQAEQLAQALAQQQLAFSALHVSELTRARQTATAISRQLGLPLQTHPALKERHYGAFQGHTFDEAREHIPHAYRLHQERTCISTCKAAKACTTFSSASCTACSNWQSTMRESRLWWSAMAAYWRWCTAPPAARA
jgi:broad specificity phosphatase PhoE